MVKKRVLIMGDSPSLNTGYSRVGRFVANTLHGSGKYEVRYLPSNADNPQSDNRIDCFQYQFDLGDRYNVGRITAVIQEYMPALVIIFGEFAYVAYVGNVCRELGTKSLYYFPIEGKDFPPDRVYLPGGHVDYRQVLSKFHYVLAYSEFGKTEIHKLMPGLVTDIMPHQVNLKTFRPLDKEACYRIYLPNLLEDPNIGYDKIFLVGAVYRNMRRKGVDLLLRGFASFLERHEDKAYKQAFLFLVMDPKDVYGYNLKNLIDNYGLQGRVILHPVIAGKAGPPDNVLCEIYNMFDVHCCPFRGEGFGIPIVESLACGVRTVCTNFATPAIFGKGVCDFVEPVDFEPVPSTNCHWAVVLPDDIAYSLNVVYRDKSTKQEYKAGVECAKQFAEPVVAAQWLELLDDMDLPQVVSLNEEATPVDDAQATVDTYFGVLEE